MTNTATLDRANDAVSAQRAPVRAKDDAAMLKAAATLTRDLNAPKDAIYWTDMLGSAVLGYAALFAAMFVRPTWL
ncbi:MAG: fatty acid desaturase, partial [Sphingomonas sp.]|nr:fatty acid desaturase [Sphingomonas sp.]